MSNAFLASAGIVCYNQVQYIRQTIESVLAQKTTFEFEVVIGDDDSKDGTRKIVEEYQLKYPGKVKLLPKAPNKGVLRNYRDVVKECGGKYVAFCSGDDYWHDPFKFQKQVDFLENNPDYGLVHTDADYYFEERGFVIHNYKSKNKNIVDGYVFEPLLKEQFMISSLTTCFKKEYLDEFVDLTLYYELGFIAEDYPTWLELSQHTKFKYIPENTATYRVLANSISRPSDVTKKFKYFESNYEVKKFFLKKFNVEQNLQYELEELYHKDKFELSYQWCKYPEAVLSYDYLKKKNMVNLKLKLKMAAIKYPFLYGILRKIKKLYKPKEDQAAMS